MEVPMSGKRYTEEFKIEAVKQLTGGGYPVGISVTKIEAMIKSGCILDGCYWKTVSFVHCGFRHQEIITETQLTWQYPASASPGTGIVLC
jgi:hypothetical protein